MPQSSEPEHFSSEIVVRNTAAMQVRDQFGFGSALEVTPGVTLLNINNVGVMLTAHGN